MNPRLASLPPQGHHLWQKGVSLVELMVALAIGSFIVLVVATLFANVSLGFRANDDSGSANENGHFALRLLTDDLRMSGFIGLFNDPARIEISRTNMISEIASENCGDQSWPLRFIKSDNTLGYIEYAPNLSTNNPFSACISASNFVANSPAIVVRHATGFAVPDTDGDGSLANNFADDDNQLYLQSSPKGAIVFMGKDYKEGIKASSRHRAIFWRNALGTVSEIDAPAFRYAVYLYYIRPCSRPTGAGGVCTPTDDNAAPIPTLVRRQLSNTDPAVLVETPVAEGVERIGLMYGIDTNDDGTPDSYTSTLTNPDQAMTVRIALLLRTRELQAGYDDSPYTYDFGSATFNCTAAAAPCNYRRFVMSDTVQLKNYALRRQ